MDPADLVKLCEILNPENKPGRLTVIVRMGAEKLRQKLPLLIRAVRQAGCIVTWVSDPMHGNTIKAPASGIKTRPFNAILVRIHPSLTTHSYRAMKKKITVFCNFSCATNVVVCNYFMIRKIIAKVQFFYLFVNGFLLTIF
jgi:3-deoxy-D-arabino-heptulosonate 7-phosphate (DAHP) synthase class II